MTLDCVNWRHLCGACSNWVRKKITEPGDHNLSTDFKQEPGSCSHNPETASRKYNQFRVKQRGVRRFLHRWPCRLIVFFHVPHHVNGLLALHSFYCIRHEGNRVRSVLIVVCKFRDKKNKYTLLFFCWSRPCPYIAAWPLFCCINVRLSVLVTGKLLAWRSPPSRFPNTRPLSFYVKSAGNRRASPIKDCTSDAR